MELVRFPNLLLLVGNKTGMGCNYKDPDKAPYFLMIRNAVVKQNKKIRLSFVGQSGKRTSNKDQNTLKMNVFDKQVGFKNLTGVKTF